MADDHELQDLLGKLSAEVFGNTNPQDSLKARLCILEKKFGRMEKINLLILAGVIALSGNLVVEIVKHQINGG